MERKRCNGMLPGSGEYFILLRVGNRVDEEEGCAIEQPNRQATVVKIDEAISGPPRSTQRRRALADLAVSKMSPRPGSTHEEAS